MNVLVIACDTLRADHLGCYGYERATSPNLDAFAAESVVFDSMIAPSIPTHPAFTTINSGQFSITHGVVSHGGKEPLPRGIPWLPMLMQQAGHTTCAVDNLADWRHGFGRGFEFYVDPSSKRKLAINCDNRDINRRAIPWLEAHKDESFYMLIHYWDPHTPYLPPRAYRTLFYQGDPNDPDNHSLDAMDAHPLGKAWRDTWFSKLGPRITDAEYIAALYDGEIRYCDEGIGKLLKAVDQFGLRENTLVVFLSDHGELMYRHGVFFDHHGLYEGNVHVPLIVRHPECSPGRVSDLVAHVDVAPTVLDACGAPAPEAMDGVSLMPHMRGEAAGPVRDFVVCQECTWQMKWAIRTPRHKFILAREQDFYGTPMRELYDLEADPHELRNIVDEQPETAVALEGQLEGWIADKMAQNELTTDPLVAHGLTLGSAWKDQPADE
ncbi:MAG: sulfatase-like hydrolase/transferase [bacterium]|nr:sulfatase-like hydrolase/transferase [bacterium]